MHMAKFSCAQWNERNLGQGEQIETTQSIGKTIMLSLECSNRKTTDEMFQPNEASDHLHFISLF